MEAESIQSTESTETYLKLLAWLHANRIKLMIGAGVVVVIALTAVIMSWQKGETESNANMQLMSLPLGVMRDGQMVPAPADPFLDLAKQYPDTSSGEYAALLGAESLFVAGKYPEAHEEFSKFIDQYPASTLLSQAKVGLAASLEGEGKIAEAAQKYQEIISTYASEANIVAPAKLTLARLDEELNKPEQALTYYGDLARNNNPYDPWAGEARERGELLLSKHPELRPQQPPPGAASAPPAASEPAGLDLFPSSPSKP